MANYFPHCAGEDVHVRSASTGRLVMCISTNDYEDSSDLPPEPEALPRGAMIFSPKHSADQHLYIINRKLMDEYVFAEG